MSIRAPFILTQVNPFVCIATTLAFLPPQIEIAYMYKSIGLHPLVVLQLRYHMSFTFSAKTCFIETHNSLKTLSWLECIFDSF